MKKYLRLSCSVCKRTTDKLVNDSHFSTDKCTITLKCEGRLSPVQYRSSGGITSAPEVGVLDWRPRGQIQTGSTSLQSTTLVNTSTGKLSQVVLAVSLTPAQELAVTSLTLRLDQRADTPKAYRQYVYRIEGSFSSVSGVEAGLEKKTLRYSSTDSVEVFLNGVKLVNGPSANDFQLFNGSGSNGVPSNTVNFNTSISLPGITQVDVIVSPAVTTNTVDLLFFRNTNDESRRNSGSWENVDYVLMFNGFQRVPYYLFTLDLDDGVSLNLNSILTVSANAVLNNSDQVLPSSMHVLLAHAPYSQADRYTNFTIPLDTLNFDTEYLKYYLVDGVPALYGTMASISQLYPPLEIQRFVVESTIKTPVPGFTNQIVIDGSVIVGPDS